jgi:ribosomal protein S7
MKTKFLKKTKLLLKNVILNKFMKNGQKKTVEKILLKCTKYLQKEYAKNSIEVFQTSIINTSPAFLIHSRVMKKGKKRKIKKEVPAFLSSYSHRVHNSVDFIKKSILIEKKISYFCDAFSKEIVKSSLSNSVSITKKVDVQNQVLLKKRYWVNFKW